MEETIVYFIRHAKAPFSLENYHDRSLSSEGKTATKNLVKLFNSVPVDVFVSSSSPREVETIKPVALAKNKSIETYDELRELLLRGPETFIEEDKIEAEIEKVIANESYKLPGGESASEVLGRGLPIFQKILEQYAGKTIVLGTHGIIMTLMLRSFDSSIGFDFWKQTTKPDVYRAVFNNKKMKKVQRLLK
jgi:2,3-bisphosphoglycerate-dependent phosphoglycerate mutase